MLVVVVSVQVMVIDVAICMVALRLLGGLGTISVKLFRLYNIVCIDGPIICSKEWNMYRSVYVK